MSMETSWFLDFHELFVCIVHMFSTYGCSLNPNHCWIRNFLFSSSHCPLDISNLLPMTLFNWVGPRSLHASSHKRSWLKTGWEANSNKTEFVPWMGLVGWLVAMGVCVFWRLLCTLILLQQFQGQLVLCVIQFWMIGDMCLQRSVKFSEYVIGLWWAFVWVLTNNYCFHRPTIRNIEYICVSKAPLEFILVMRICSAKIFLLWNASPCIFLNVLRWIETAAPSGCGGFFKVSVYAQENGDEMHQMIVLVFVCRMPQAMWSSGRSHEGLWLQTLARYSFNAITSIDFFNVYINGSSAASWNIYLMHEHFPAERLFVDWCVDAAGFIWRQGEGAVWNGRITLSTLLGTCVCWF